MLTWDYGIQSITSSMTSAYSTDDPLLVDGYVISYHLSSNQFSNDKLEPNSVANSGGSGVGGAGNDDWQSVTISSSSTSTYTLQNLRCGSEYIVRIEAFNEMGSGKPSEPIRFSTLGTGN